MNTRKETNNVFFFTWWTHKKQLTPVFNELSKTTGRCDEKDDLVILGALYYRFDGNISCGPGQVQSSNGSSQTRVGNINWI